MQYSEKCIAYTLDDIVFSTVSPMMKNSGALHLLLRFLCLRDRSTGGNRTAGQIAARVRELNLHLMLTHSEDEGEKASENGDTEPEGEPSMISSPGAADPAEAVEAPQSETKLKNTSNVTDTAFWEEPDDEDDARWKATSNLVSAPSVVAARQAIEHVTQPSATMKPKLVRKKKAMSDDESDQDNSFVEDEPKRSTYHSVLVDSDDE